MSSVCGAGQERTIEKKEARFRGLLILEIRIQAMNCMKVFKHQAKEPTKCMRVVASILIQFVMFSMANKYGRKP